MDVDAAPGEMRRLLVRQDLHVARQHHHIGLIFLEQLINMGESFLFVFLAYRHVVVGNLMPLHHPAQVVVVGDDRHDLGIDLLAVPAVQQISHTMGFLAAHQDDFLGLGRVGNVPVHIEFAGNRLKRGAELVQTERNRGGLDLVPHEKPAGLRVGMVTRLGNPAIVCRQKITHLGDNSHPVGAGNHKTIGMLHESLSLTEIRESRCVGESPPTLTAG